MSASCREVAVQDLVGHLFTEVSRRKHQPEIRPKIGCFLEKAFSVALGVIRGTRHHYLAGSLMGDDCGKNPKFLFFSQAAVFAVGSECQVAQHAAFRIAVEVVNECIEVD